MWGSFPYWTKYSCSSSKNPSFLYFYSSILFNDNRHRGTKNGWPDFAFSTLLMVHLLAAFRCYIGTIIEQHTQYLANIIYSESKFTSLSVFRGNYFVCFFGCRHNRWKASFTPNLFFPIVSLQLFGIYIYMCYLFSFSAS